jgi:predicted DNA-binding protein YlxM (UPF0122 family)
MNNDKTILLTILEQNCENFMKIGERNRSIVEDYLYKNSSAQQLANEYGISRQRVHQIINNTIRNIQPLSIDNEKLKDCVISNSIISILKTNYLLKGRRLFNIEIPLLNIPNMKKVSAERILSLLGIGTMRRLWVIIEDEIDKEYGISQQPIKEVLKINPQPDVDKEKLKACIISTLEKNYIIRGRRLDNIEISLLNIPGMSNVTVGKIFKMLEINCTGQLWDLVKVDFKRVFS